MGMQTTGRIHAKFEAKQVTERFRKREFVLELADNPRYPQFVQFQLSGDRCESLDDFEVGDSVNVEFSLRGREWTSPQGEVRYFNSLDVWTVERAGDSPAAQGRGGNSPAARGRGGDDLDPPPPSDADDIPF